MRENSASGVQGERLGQRVTMTSRQARSRKLQACNSPRALAEGQVDQYDDVFPVRLSEEASVPGMSTGVTMSDPLVSLSEFLRDALALEALAAYSAGLVKGLPEGVERHVDPETVRYMTTEGGRADVREWAALFDRTLAELAALRNRAAHHPEMVSIADLDEGRLAQERAFKGLRTWLAGPAHGTPANTQRQAS